MDTIAKISYLLEKNNRTQKELTDYLGLDKSTFSAWKNGKSKSYSKYFTQIAQFFNVSIDYLLDNEKSSPSTDEELSENDEIVILNRNAKKLSPEQQKLLNDVVRQMLKEDFDD